MMKRMIAWVITLTLLMSLVPQVTMGVAAEEVQTPPAAHSHCAQQHECDHCDETVTWHATRTSF